MSGPDLRLQLRPAFHDGQTACSTNGNMCQAVFRKETSDYITFLKWVFF